MVTSSRDVPPGHAVPRRAPGGTTSLPRNRYLSRRGLLATTAGAAGTAMLSLAARQAGQQPRSALAAQHDDHAAATPAAGDRITWAPADLIEPEVRRSTSGLLETSLRVAYAYQDVGGYRLFKRTYDGSAPGPTLRMQPGDTIRIQLTNDLPPNRDTAPLNTDQAHHLNSTNFHFHGGHVSPSGIADNVLRDMEPGRTYDIEIELPADHPSGLYWYHPHLHGAADVQIASGMAGAIIVEGDFAGVPEIEAASERLLIIGEAVFDQLGTVEDFDTVWPETATRFLTVNGQREPVLRMRPGEVQRWRVLHTGYQSDVLLQLDGHQLQAIAYDGITLPASEQQDALLMAPGQRADLLVRAGAVGVYPLVALPHDQGYPSPEGPLATLIVEGEPMPMDLPATLPPAPFAPIGDDELTGSRELVFSARTPENDAAGHWQEFDFMVDGQLFDPDRVDQQVTLGAVEEWTITNTHLHDHVFHIHVNPFQVTMVNGEPLAEPVWRDTVIVPGFGSVTFRTRFLDFTGRYVLHCHMMNHEEMGMMQIVEVVEG